MNFLVRQAARSLARGAMVRPRLPALFEPVAEGPEPSPIEVPVMETPRGGETPPVQPAETPALRNAAVPAAGPEASRLRFHTVEQVLQREVKSVREVIERVIPRETSERTIVEHHHVREVAPPREVIPERIIQTTVERTREIAPQPIETQTHPIETHARIETRPTVTPITPALPTPVVMRPAERPQRAIAQPVDAAPTIHVTIGRVDVRAVLTSDAPAPRATSSTPPSLSLDDYLKQRGSR